MGPGTIILLLIAFFVIFMVAKGVRIIQQSEAMIIERFGKYRETLTAGFNVITPAPTTPTLPTGRKPAAAAGANQPLSVRCLAVSRSEKA